VTSRATLKLWATISVAALLAFVAASVADPTGNTATPAKTSYYVAGHVFGIGEQQVYIVQRTAMLTVHFRDASGALQTRAFKQADRESVAWTIEGIASDGGPILGVNTAAPAATASPSATPTPSASPTATPTPGPSPKLDAHGAGSASGALGDLGAANFLLASLTTDLPDIGRLWFSKGLVPLKFGTLTLSMNNIVNQPTGDQGNVLSISSTGGCAYAAKLPVSGFGVASLRGGGGASGQSFVESQDRLLLGMTLFAHSRGNAKAKDHSGSYTLEMNETIKLVHYIPGIPVYVGSVGFVPASAYLGNAATADTSIFSTGNPEPVSSPAATNTEFIPAPMAPVTPYPSALPEVSLPPIPIPQSSDQPVASPPAPPTPTPTPSVYP
jgi:hypothetical protein